MILQSKTLVYTRKSHHAHKQASSRQKITAQNERYLNHITLAQPLERDTYQAQKITAQNERYLNHISLVARKSGEFPSLPGTHILTRRAEDWRPKTLVRRTG